MTHGTLYAYGVRGCRCARCRKAKSKAAKKYHRRKLAKVGKIPHRPKAKHGTNSKYSTGCRCDLCREAHRQYRLLQNRREGYRERVSAVPLRPLVACLLEAPLGITQERIAEATGCSYKTLWLKHDTVLARTAEAIEKLHWGLWWRHGPFRKHCTCEIPERILQQWEAA